METRQTELVTDDGRWKVALVDLTESLGTWVWCVYDMRASASHWPVWMLPEDDPYEEHEPGELDANDVLTRFLSSRGWSE